MNFGKTLFQDRRMSSAVGNVKKKVYGGYCVARKGRDICMSDFETSNFYSMGVVLEKELGLAKNMKFAVAGAEHTQFVIWEDGLYEKVGDKWHNVTHIMHKTPVMKRYLDNNTEIVHYGNCYQEMDYFMVGDIIKGDNIRYGITSNKMLRGKILDIVYGEASIEVLEMVDGLERFEGTVQLANLYDNGRKNFIRLERGVANED